MKKTFTCPFCGKKLEKEEAATGRSVQCPKCNKFFQLTLPSENPLSGNSAESSGERIANPLKKKENSSEADDMPSEPVFVRDGIVANPLQKKKGRDLPEIEEPVIDEYGNVSNPLAKIRQARQAAEKNAKKRSVDVDEMIADIREEQEQERKQQEAAQARPTASSTSGSSSAILGNPEDNPLAPGIRYVKQNEESSQSEKTRHSEQKVYGIGGKTDSSRDRKSDSTRESGKLRKRSATKIGFAALLSDKEFDFKNKNQLLQLAGDCMRSFWMFLVVSGVFWFVVIGITFIPSEQLDAIGQFISPGKLKIIAQLTAVAISAITGILFTIKYFQLLAKLLKFDALLIAIILSCIPPINLFLFWMAVKKASVAGKNRYSS